MVACPRERTANRLMHWRRLGRQSLVLVAAGAVLAISGCNVAPAGLFELVGRVAGQFELQRAGSVVWLRAASADPASLRMGDRVRTLQGNRATVTLVGDTEIKVAPATTLEITAAGTSRATELLQRSGAIEVTARTPLTLRTSLITAGIRGTVFRVEASSGTRQRLATDEGAVQVDVGKESVLVRQGQEVEAEYGKRLVARPQRLAAPTLGEPTIDAAGILSVAGGTESNRMVEVIVDGQVDGQAASGDDGAYTYALGTLDPGPHSVQAVTLGPEGLRSQPSPFLVVGAGASGQPPLYLSVTSVMRQSDPARPNVQEIRGKTRPSTSVQFEGQPASVDAEGNVSATVSLAVGAGSIRTVLASGGASLEGFLQVAP